MVSVEYREYFPMRELSEETQHGETCFFPVRFGSGNFSNAR